jgi:hypothetical protein
MELYIHVPTAECTVARHLVFPSSREIRNHFGTVFSLVPFHSAPDANFIILSCEPKLELYNSILAFLLFGEN